MSGTKRSRIHQRHVEFRIRLHNSPSECIAAANPYCNNASQLTPPLQCTAPPLLTEVLFAIFKASSSVSNLMIDETGPKISSFPISMSIVTSPKTVGWMKYPLSPWRLPVMTETFSNIKQSGLELDSARSRSGRLTSRQELGRLLPRLDHAHDLLVLHLDREHQPHRQPI